jgi:hypothetical protein
MSFDIGPLQVIGFDIGPLQSAPPVPPSGSGTGSTGHWFSDLWALDIGDQSNDGSENDLDLL